MRTASVLFYDQSNRSIGMQSCSRKYEPSRSQRVLQSSPATDADMHSVTQHSKEEPPQQEEPAEPVERTLLRLLMDVGAAGFPPYVWQGFPVQH